MYDIFDIYDYGYIIEFAGVDGNYMEFKTNSNKVFFLPTNGSGDRYSNMALNSHHYTTKYHYDIVLPLLNSLFNFGFDISDFDLIDKLHKEGDFCFDLSFLFPKNDKKFNVNGLDYDISYISNYNGLICNSNCPDEIYNTEYHKLYAFPHSCSIIENLGDNNGKTILISGDSQNVPHVPILAYYYKKVYYMDNRENKSHFKWLKDAKFDDIIVCPFDKQEEYYIKNNLR